MPLTEPEAKALLPEEGIALPRDSQTSSSLQAGRQITLVLDESGYLVSYNLAAGDFFGFNAWQEAGNLNLLDIIAPQERSQAACELGRCLRNGAEATLAYTLVHRDGRSFPARLSSQPRLSAGRPVGMIISCDL